VVRDVDFAKVFETGVADRLGNNSSYTQNFRFMTETCLVRDYWVDKIPAVVHRDQTARPQILSREDNPLIYDALGILAEQENLPVLINTSFNAHEEPIIFDEEQGIDELSNGRVDVLVSESFFITLNE
jgi:carbamoyltransferase